MDAYKKFTHKTPHLKGKQHQLDPNLDLKQLVHHATVQYVDRDADGDVDIYDNPKKKTPDENPIGIDFGNLSKKLIAKQKGEIRHTKRGMAYEEVEEKRYCPLCDKRETRSECSYGEKAWDKVSVKDHEYSMARSELSTVMNAVKRLQKKMGKGEGNVEAWVQSKITKAADYLDIAADYVASGEMEEACWVGYKQKGLKKKGKRMVPNCVPTNEAKTLGFEIKKSSGAGALTPDAAKQLGDKAVALQKKKAAAVTLPKLKEHRGIVADILNDIEEASKSGDSSLHDWFAKSRSSDGKPGWVQLGGKYAGKPCAKQPGQTTKPKCGSSKMSAEMSPEEEDQAARRKRREDPNPNRKGKAINVATEGYVEEDACKEKVKSRYKVWPSAYASGALVKCRKAGAKNWGNKTKNEDVNIEDLNGNTFAEVIDVIKPEPIKGFKQQVSETTRLQSETGNIIAVILNWRGKTYSIRMFFPQSGMPSKKDVTTEIQKIYPGAQVLQYNVSTLQPGMPLIQVVNSRSKNYLLNNKTIGEESIEEVSAWQRKEGKSQSGGLNEKGRKSYERENPGSNLQRPQPEGGSRRDSFCARMKGMKRKLTSAKTANDPDSRINKSLRAWNC
jgi:ribosomal protein S24E